MVKVRVFEGGKIKVKLKPEQGVKVGTDTTYLYDPTIIEAEVQQAKDWAVKTDGMVVEDGEPVDYSAKAYAVGGTGTQTNNAKYYSEQASLSATSASDSATTATTQAGIATTQAGIATTQAGTATTQAGIATSKANEASASATTATTQAGIATTQAGIATTKAGEASSSASNAHTSELNAAESEERAQIWAEGDDEEVVPLGGTHSSLASAGLAYAYANAPEDTPVETFAANHDVVVQGEKGDKGDKGDDGFSPSASVTQSGNVTTISITDKDGTTTESIDLSGYATQTWVGQQGFLTSAGIFYYGE